jgi:hypothetical protein
MKPRRSPRNGPQAVSGVYWLGLAAAVVVFADASLYLIVISQ